MSRRSAGNNVTGPTSALTEFLRENNITPTTVARRTAPIGQQETITNDAPQGQSQQEPEPPQQSTRRTRRRNAGYESDELDEPATPAKKQKTGKATQSKKTSAKGKGKAAKKGADDKDEEEDPYNALSRSLWSNQGASSSKPPVGGFDICAKCSKQFTVTKYTMAANPGPGYLCHSCAKAGGADPFKKPLVPRTRKPVATERRNVTHFQELMFPSLASLCIQIVSRHLEDIDAFGNIGALNMDAISKAISKNRCLSSENAHLFYGAENSTLTLYDATKLTTNSLITLGHLNPNLTTLRLDFCGLISDAVLNSWSSSLPKLVSLKLLGPFLIRPPAWINFFKSHSQLECFDIMQSPRFDIECLKTLIDTSGHTLTVLGLKEVGQLSDEFLEVISGTAGTIISLDISDAPQSCSDEALIQLLTAIGPTLTCLDISGHHAVSDDFLLKGLLPHAKALTTLQLRGLLELTNAGVAEFFSEWSNPPLRCLDMSRAHALGKEALYAILGHSGSGLMDLNLNGWKDAENEAFVDLAEKAPELRKIDLGFCRSVDDFTIKALLERNKGVLREIKIWGCNRIEGKWDAVYGNKHPNLRIHGLESFSVI